MTTSIGISLTEHVTSYGHHHTPRLKTVKCTTDMHATCAYSLHTIHEEFNDHIMTIYIIFTINILHFYLEILEGTISVALQTRSLKLHPPAADSKTPTNLRAFHNDGRSL